MRPIALDMHGFASFREPTHVDFTDAEFFALVGPTGSGKSTVIDAMTFALYGSVPRWDDKRVVALALAPTVTRGTVKLVFEVDRDRYVVVRELRRSSADKVTQKAASLEQILRPGGLAGPGEPTAPMAKDLAGVTEAVEKLLGLSYEDFIQCVVLPQGQFADFLHAKPRDRQDILLRLLGAEHYNQMMKQANQRAGAAGQRAETFAETLLAYADATPEAQAQAQAAEQALARLGERVQQAGPRIQDGQAALATAEASLTRLRGEHAALAALRVPDDVGALDADLAASRAALGRLRDAEMAAEKADGEAREALAAGPDRAGLLLVRDRRDERNHRQSQLPGLEASAARLAAQATAAAEAVDAAQATLDELRGQRDDASRTLEATRDRVTRLAADHGRLSAVSVPGGVATLDERRQAALVAEAEAGAAVAAAEEAEAAARAARTAAVPEAPLAQVSRDLHDLRGLSADLAAAQADAGRARIAREAAQAALDAAEEDRRQRQAGLEAAQRAHVLAGLRPHLVAGEPCPLCEQPLAVLPAAVPAPELDDARALFQATERTVGTAQRDRHAAAEASVKADAALGLLTTRQATVVTALATAVDGPLAAVRLPSVRAIVAARVDDDLLARAVDEAAALLRARKELEHAAEAAAEAVRAARTRQRGAREAAEQSAAQLSAARAGLRDARDPLVELGAPPADDASLAQAWATLARWAASQAQARASELAQARLAAQDAAGQHQRLAAGFDDAERSLARLRARAKAASGDDQRARESFRLASGRVAELDALLDGTPDQAQVAERLAWRDQLEKAASDAGQALRAARAGRAAGEAALARLARAEDGARRELSAARDTVVTLGAPELGGRDLFDERGLLGDWTDLVTWACGQAQARAAEITAAAGTVTAASSALKRLTGQLSEDLAGAGITLAPDAVATGAAAAVATALADARGATRRIEERQAEAAALAGRQRAAKEEQQVARLLGDLLRADHFQRWLVSAAVDDLVAEASATLAALSGGQFEFSHHAGEFFVIDHADGDAERSVRTLSGGETFQASLALALALSTQISALAATGAARLDSIFLDEGFGTLDPETLDIVASTLETLAQGDRMVGVVTHVLALAERVPVRFQVARNAQTSTITREGLGAAAPEEDI